MNGLALVLAAAIGIDYGWQPGQDGQLEYIVQIEPGLLESMKSGQEIISEIPAELRGVRRVRIRVGTGQVPRVAVAGGAGNRAAVGPPGRAAAGNRSSVTPPDAAAPGDDAAPSATSPARGRSQPESPWGRQSEDGAAGGTGEDAGEGSGEDNGVLDLPPPPWTAEERKQMHSVLVGGPRQRKSRQAQPARVAENTRRSEQTPRRSPGNGSSSAEPAGPTNPVREVTPPSIDAAPATDSAPATDIVPTTDSVPGTDLSPATDPATDASRLGSPQPHVEGQTPGWGSSSAGSGRSSSPVFPDADQSNSNSSGDTQPDRGNDGTATGWPLAPSNSSDRSGGGVLPPKPITPPGQQQPALPIRDPDARSGHESQGEETQNVASDSQTQQPGSSAADGAEPSSRSAANEQQRSVGPQAPEPEILTAAASKPTLDKRTAEQLESKPWVPLVLTSLGLFMSLAANMYLGWIAMGVYRRYRDVVDQLRQADAVTA